MSKIVDLRPRNTIQNKDVRVGNATLSTKTLELFKRAYAMDKYNTPWEKAFSDYGATQDDGWSNSEHLITGTKYYFSSSTGDDSNDGLTPATAMKTLYKAKQVSSTLNAGDGILFKRGDTWSAETENMSVLTYRIVGELGKPIVFSCYGVGYMPKFSTLKTQTALTWTDNGDGTWYSEDIYAPTKRIRTLKMNGAYEPCSLDFTSLLDDENAKWHHDTANGRLYIKDDPTTVTIEFAEHENILTLKYDSYYVHISRLNMEHTREANISCGTSYNITINDCRLGAYSQFGIVAGRVSTIVNNIIDSKEPYYRGNSSSANNYPIGGYEGIRLYPLKNGYDGTVVSHNTVSNFRHGSIIINGSTVDGEVSLNLKVYKNILYANPNIMDYAARFAIQENCGNVGFYDNIVLNATISQIMGDSQYVKHNLFYKSRNSITKDYNTGHAMAFNISQPIGATDITITDNAYYKCDGAALRVTPSSIGKISGVDFNRNILYSNGQDKPVYPANAANGVQLLMLKDEYGYGVDININDNIQVSEYTDKVIAYSTEAGLNDISNYYTLDEFKALVDSGIPEVASFERNVNVDLAELVEV